MIKVRKHIVLILPLILLGVFITTPLKIFANSNSQSSSSTATKYRNLTLPSGQTIKMMSVTNVLYGPNRNKTILLKYFTDKNLKDNNLLAQEVDDVWDIFMQDAMNSGFSTAIISAGANGTAANSNNNQTAFVDFIIDKNINGTWSCSNDKLVCVGTPAKVAYRTAYKQFLQHHYDEALKLYSQSISLNPNFAQAYVDRGGIYLILNNLDKSIADSNQALAIMPENAGAFCNRGIASLRQNQFPTAINDLSHALRINPRLGVAYARRGEAFIKTNEYDKAIADLTIAINQQQQLANSYYNRSVAYEKLASIDKQKSFAFGYKEPQNISIAQHANASTHSH